MTPLPARLDDLIAYVIARQPEAGPLVHLGDAMLTADQLGELQDHLIGHFVDQARRSGASWSEIGNALGVSKQAAQQRFVPRSFAAGDASDPSRFGRFTGRARNVVVKAEEHARTAGNDEVGLVHLVLGLLDEPHALAARAIEDQGVSLATVAQVASAALPAAAVVPEHIPFSAPSKKLLELTLREALRLGHNYIGTEHLLLALLDGGAWPDGHPLLILGLQRDRAETWITAELGDPGPRSAPQG